MVRPARPSIFFFFNDTATTEIYTLSLHDALPIYILRRGVPRTQSLSKIFNRARQSIRKVGARRPKDLLPGQGDIRFPADRKSTRLNSSHDQISYAVFCLKKKNLSIHRFPCG